MNGSSDCFHFDSCGLNSSITDGMLSPSLHHSKRENFTGWISASFAELRTSELKTTDNIYENQKAALQAFVHAMTSTQTGASKDVLVPVLQKVFTNISAEQR